MLQQTSYSRHELESLFDTGTHSQAKMQLPQGQMRMIDRITRVDAKGGNFGKGLILAEFDIHPDLWFFDCHFPGDPIMPGCLGLDALWQSLGFFLAWSGYEGKGRALGVGGVKFFGEVLPDAHTVEYRVHVKRIVNRDIVIGLADGEVWVDGSQIYSAENLRTCLVPHPSQRALS